MGTQGRRTQLDTVIVSFDMCVVRPSLQEVEKVITSDMKLDVNLISGLQLHHTKNCAIIRFKSTDSAKLFVETNNFKHRIHNQHHSCLIPVYLDDDTVEVSVHDIPMSIHNRAIAVPISKYGDIVSVRHDTWKKVFKGVYNGVRIFTMRLQKEIPSYVKVEIDGQTYTAFITYKNQTSTCKWCQDTVHNGRTCLEAAKLKTQDGKNTTEPASQASATASSSNTEAAPAPTPALSPKAVPAVLTQTSSPNLPKAQQQESSTAMDSNEFITVERKKITATRNRLPAPLSNNDDNSETQPGEDGAHFDVASPPRKQMITRSIKKNAAAPGTV